MNLEEQLRIIERGTVDILTREALMERLNEDRPLNVKFGIDPTAPDIHLGHTVPLQKLRQFQDIGHNIQLVIGDFTALIGDPSGRSKTRPMLTSEQISKNLQSYLMQVFKILDKDRTNTYYNSTWLGALTAKDIIELCSKTTVQKLLQRRDFSKRIEENAPLTMTELIYPLLVGYDSVHLKTDIEIGGTDQLFNFIASKDTQESYGQKPEIIITLPLLEGLDGIKKMSKSLGNAVGIDDKPDQMYGKLMSISDELMIKYYELLSNVSLGEVNLVKSVVAEKSDNPMIYKQKLARELVQLYHGANAASSAEENFNRLHRKKELPEEIEKKQIFYSSEESLGIVQIIRTLGLATSNGNAKRLIEQGGVRVNNERITDITYCLQPKPGTIIQVGKRTFKELYFSEK